MITRSLEGARGLLRSTWDPRSVLRLCECHDRRPHAPARVDWDRRGLGEGYHGPVLTLAIGAHPDPCVPLGPTALAAQVVPPEGERRATMQETSTPESLDLVGSRCGMADVDRPPLRCAGDLG